MFEGKEDKSTESGKAAQLGDSRVISEPQFESNGVKGEESGVPILMCMTFADKLLAEELDEKGEYNEGKVKKDIAKHFEVKKD